MTEDIRPCLLGACTFIEANAPNLTSEAQVAAAVDVDLEQLDRVFQCYLGFALADYLMHHKRHAGLC